MPSTHRIHGFATRIADAPAAAIALAATAVLLGGALLFEHVGGLVPCEMCMWQRWPHLAALLLAALAIALPKGRPARIATACSAGGIVTSGIIAVDHLGVERHWWAGHTACTASMPKGLSTSEYLEHMMRMPLHRCDVPQWTIAGLSLADLNAILSLTIASVIVMFMFRGSRLPEPVVGN